MPLTSHSVKARLLTCIIAAGLCSIAVVDVFAGDCGCQSDCHSCSTINRNHCSCDFPTWPKHNCLKKAWGAVAGQMGKMIDWCGSHPGCDDANCDDACDAAMIEELMTPHAPMHPQEYDAPMYPQEYAEPMYPQEYAAPPYPQAAPLHTSEPPAPMVMGGGRTSESSTLSPTPRDRVPPPVRTPVPDTKSDTDGGSLFDTLSDPFKDDNDARVKRSRSVRPSNYYSTSSKSQAVGSSLSRGYPTSSRRVSRSVR